VRHAPYRVARCNTQRRAIRLCCAAGRVLHEGAAGRKHACDGPSQLLRHVARRQRCVHRTGRPRLRRDWAHPCHICAGTGLTGADICTGTGLTPTSARLRRAFASLPRRISTGCDGGNTLVALVAMMVEPRASRWARPYVALGNKELPCGASVDASSLSFGVKQGQVGSGAAPARHGSATHCGATRFSLGIRVRWPSRLRVLASIMPTHGRRNSALGFFGRFRRGSCFAICLALLCFLSRASPFSIPIDRCTRS
jgi:hypothetical protein